MRVTFILILVCSVLSSQAQFASEEVIYENGQSLSGINDIKMGDIDQDGDMDAVVASANNDKVFHLLNDGNGIFDAPEVITYKSLNPQDLALADVNDDGNIDILAVSQSFTVLEWLLGDGDGNFDDNLTIASNRTFLGIPYLSVSVSNIAGAIVFEKEVSQNSQFETIDWPTGTYTGHFNAAQESAHHSLIILE